MKTKYVAPTFRAHGTLEALTQGNKTGNNLDADFPSGTPFGDLTFS
jgi:hypothetical protein